MPKTKIQDEVDRMNRAPRKKAQITLLDIPDLPTTVTIQKASEIVGLGYQAIKQLIEKKTITAIRAGSKQVIPTWDLLVQLKIFPEHLLEKIYLERLSKKETEK